MFGSIISCVVSVALYNLALGLMSGRFTEVTFDAFKLPFATYLKAFVVSFIVGVILVISCFFCLIPVFFLAPRLILAPIYQVATPSPCLVWASSCLVSSSLVSVAVVLVFISLMLSSYLL